MMLVAGSSLRAQVTWNVGDVFVAVGGGQYEVYDNTGAFKQTITDSFAKGATAGCGFDSLFNLYTTNFDSSAVTEFAGTDPHAVVQTILTGSNSNSASPESIVFDSSGNFYVAHADSLVSGKVVKGGGKLEKYNTVGVFQTFFSPMAENRGTDWIDLANDQKTLFYTSEGLEVLKFNVVNATQLSPFATLPKGTGPAFAIRLLPRVDATGIVHLDGSGGLLVADTASIKRLDSSGNVKQSYGGGLGNNLQFQALALDPNGTSFWAGDAKGDNFYRFNIASGAVEVGPISTGPSTSLGGMCVKGELRLNIVPLFYNTGTNVQNFAGFADPATNNFHTWGATFDNVISPFILALSATEGIDLSRFDEYFCNQAEPGTGLFGCQPPQPPATFQLTLTPITYADQVSASGTPQQGTAAVYRVENPPPSASYSGNIVVIVGYHQPSTVSYTPLQCPASSGSSTFVTTDNPRLFRDPSSSPPDDAAENHSFAFDFTTFVSRLSKIGDPIGGTVNKTNDYVVADRCPSVAGATATFNSPLPKQKVKSGSAVPVKITVLDGSGNAVTDAVNFPNDITLSVSLVGGPLERDFFNPGNSHSFFTSLGKGVYGANLDTTGLSTGLTALCVTSVDKTEVNNNVGTATRPGEFPAPPCEQINIVP
jgi:hypothetical protein